MNRQRHRVSFLPSFSTHNHTGANSAGSLGLNVESLEARMMLSTVSVVAVGQEGGEIMKVYANDELLIEETMTNSAHSFSAATEGPVSADQVRIEFVNDEYRPADNFDRNLTILEFEVDEQSIAFDSSMFSTGTYDSSTGIQDGFGRGNTLHTNGYFQYRPAVSHSITFQDRVWSIDGDSNRVTGDNTEVNLDGSAGPVSISSEFDVVGNTLYRLTAEAHRDAIESFDQGQPWSTIGVNFYDLSGNEVGQQRFDVTSNHQDPATSLSTEFIVADSASSAFVWAWIGVGPNVPLVVNQIAFEPVDLTADTTPPQAELQSFTLTEPTGQELNFGVVFTDDTRLGNPIPEPFLVTGPNGFEELAGVRTGLPGSTNTEQTLIYGLVKPDGSDWGTQDNGIYTVELLPGALADQAGNQTAAQVLGTFELAIVLPPADTEPPQVSLGPTPNITEAIADPYQFVVYTTDNRSPIPYTDSVSIIRPDGSETEAIGIAGGFDAPNNRNWQLYKAFPLTAANNGEYQIRLKAGDLVDASGNEAAAQVLGSFVVDIDVVVG